MISITKSLKSVRHAVNGLAQVWAHEHSFRVHIFALIVLVVVMAWLPIRGTDAALLFIVAAIVLVLELVNSIFERFIDIVSPRVGSQVRDMKDIMAGAVLVASVGALVVGLIVILPYFRQ